MIPLPAAPIVTDLQRRLLAWFDVHGRDLPWRRHRTLYGTWIAEMMLQQTTVAAVVPYWERFLARFPEVTALAAAAEDAVLAHWSGLGYYRRARQLHAAARLVVDRHGGRLPRDRAGWLNLPGVGPYAAGAIASQGLGEAVPAVDANARRVLLRWLADDPQIAAATSGPHLEAAAARFVPAVRAGDWNEAVMELGALVCRAREPACGACPVRPACRAGLAGAASRIPPPIPRTEPTPVAVGALVVHDGTRALLMPAQAQPVLVPTAWGSPARSRLAGLHRGLWGPPGSAWYGQLDPVATRRAWRIWLKAAGVDSPQVVAAGETRHVITRWRLRVQVAAARLPAGALEAITAALDGRCEAPGTDAPLSRMADKILGRCGLQAVDR